VAKVHACAAGERVQEPDVGFGKRAAREAARDVNFFDVGAGEEGEEKVPGWVEAIV
jgi:hypothetical protein